MQSNTNRRHARWNTENNSVITLRSLLSHFSKESFVTSFQIYHHSQHHSFVSISNPSDLPVNSQCVTTRKTSFYFCACFPLITSAVTTQTKDDVIHSISHSFINVLMTSTAVKKSKVAKTLLVPFQRFIYYEMQKKYIVWRNSAVKWRHLQCWKTEQRKTTDDNTPKPKNTQHIVARHLQGGTERKGWTVL